MFGRLDRYDSQEGSEIVSDDFPHRTSTWALCHPPLIVAASSLEVFLLLRMS